MLEVEFDKSIINNWNNLNLNLLSFDAFLKTFAQKRFVLSSSLFVSVIVFEFKKFKVFVIEFNILLFISTLVLLENWSNKLDTISLVSSFCAIKSFANFLYDCVLKDVIVWVKPGAKGSSFIGLTIESTKYTLPGIKDFVFSISSIYWFSKGNKIVPSFISGKLFKHAKSLIFLEIPCMSTGLEKKFIGISPVTNSPKLVFVEFNCVSEFILNLFCIAGEKFFDNNKILDKVVASIDIFFVSFVPNSDNLVTKES